jgi:DNA-binding NtrC family response regulator
VIEKEFEYSISVLIVDSDESTRRLLGETLHALGYKTFQAAAISDAWNFINSYVIDLVITDIFVPQGEGLELMFKVKKDNPAIPVIIMTSVLDDATQAELVKAGADAVLTKPFRIQRAEELIATTLIKLDKIALSSHKISKRILVVDDDAELLGFIVDAVISLGFEVEARADGNAALKSFYEDNFDLVISDFMLSDMNGVDLLKSMKKTKPDIPFILITGYPIAYPPALAKSDGVDGYLVKPFRINQIEQIMIELLFPHKIQNGLDRNKKADAEN